MKKVSFFLQNIKDFIDFPGDLRSGNDMYVLSRVFRTELHKQTSPPNCDSVTNWSRLYGQPSAQQQFQGNVMSWETI